MPSSSILTVGTFGSVTGSLAQAGASASARSAASFIMEMRVMRLPFLAPPFLRRSPEVTRARGELFPRSVAGRRGGRRVPDVDDAAPLPIGIDAPDAHTATRKRDRLPVGSGDGRLAGRAHVGQRAVGREDGVLRGPVNLEARDLQAGLDE